MVHFGPFAIDTRTWTLSRDGAPIELSPRLVEILAYLVERDGAIATRDELLDRFWPDVHVTENTLTRAIADIRKALDDPAGRPRVIQTLARRGYRFVGDLAAPEPVADPFRQWVAGRLALESLDQSRLAEARAAMQAAAAAMPDYAPAQAGLANACVVSFEATRSSNRPDVGLLQTGLAAAHRAAALDARLGEAWAVMAHAQTLAGRRDQSQASARRAVALEPGNWRHHFRLALASWGEERLRAADRALTLSPSCAAAHLLSAMVFVARGAWDRAGSAAEAGARLQDAQPAGAVLPASGLHWMRGLVCTAQQRTAEAIDAFNAEMAATDIGVFAPEFQWLASTSLGFLHLWHGRRAEAGAAFSRAEAINPGAARGVLGRHVAGAVDAVAVERAIDELAGGPKASDAVMVRAALLAWAGDATRACDALGQLLERAHPGPAGWNLGADPMFLPLSDAERLQPFLAAVASRAA